MSNNTIRIISGGQSGVDRAALDFALNHGMQCKGWCPRGRWAEDGKIPDRYPLQETNSANPEERTRKNIEDSDGTLIIFMTEMDEGTLFTRKYVLEQDKPLFIIKHLNSVDVSSFKTWINQNNISILNIAGPRESREPGLYTLTMKVLQKLFDK